eukprot:TRINITY_DN21826_c0_g3_i1.p1 TRINITY_DN21826_c0_g3~~TRINITY_DN21826_c0_g3_i1.p1  ORF type:complete len:626 (-),score=49.97 TRINITY_DN21826_c0_g3_i1:94-1884(-)
MAHREVVSPQVRRLTQSWHSSPKERIVPPVLLPARSQSFAEGDFCPEDLQASRTFGGIERPPRLVPPTQEDFDFLRSFSVDYEQRHHERPHVVAFVNSKSGGQAGGLLMEALSKAIGPSSSTSSSSVGGVDCSGDAAMTGQVCDLSREGEPARTIMGLAEGLPSRESEMAAGIHAVRPAAVKRLLICGGDGTVTWILTALEQCPQLEGRLHLLPVAIVPLGTGNDLSRSLGWGGRLRKVSDILKYLRWIAQATPVTMDQWRVVLRPHCQLPENHKLREPGSHPQPVTDRVLSQQLLVDLEEAIGCHSPPRSRGKKDGSLSEAPSRTRQPTGEESNEIYLGFWQNYFSIGIDAKVLGLVDTARNTTSCGRGCFRHGCGKLCYAFQAVRHMHEGNNVLTDAFGLDFRTAAPLGRQTATPATLDEASRATTPMLTAASPTPLVPTPPELRPLVPPLSARRINGRKGRLRQLMMVNINSYGAGLNVLPKPGRECPSISPGDGVVEVLGLRNAFTGIGAFIRASKPTYLASAASVAFRFLPDNPRAVEWMQIDGEPWPMPGGCDVLVEPHRKVTMLCAPAEAPWWGCGHCQPDFWQDSEGA